MIDHLGLGRMAVLLVVALLVFGPERLPGIATQLGRALRQVRTTLDSMGAEIKSNVGPELAELDLKSLNPRTFLSSLMTEEEAIAAPAPAAVDPALPLPDGSSFEELLSAPVDLSSVDDELAALMAAHPAPVEPAET